EKNEGTGKLYGEWQTQPWVPEAAVDGKGITLGRSHPSLVWIMHLHWLGLSRRQGGQFLFWMA
ncbi:unnamed protein product, partial [Choristocarpus tenellus]